LNISKNLNLKCLSAISTVGVGLNFPSIDFLEFDAKYLMYFFSFWPQFRSGQSIARTGNAKEKKLENCKIIYMDMVSIDMW
jgi:hypothetical protein